MKFVNSSVHDLYGLRSDSSKSEAGLMVQARQGFGFSGWVEIDPASNI